MLATDAAVGFWYWSLFLRFLKSALSREEKTTTFVLVVIFLRVSSSHLYWQSFMICLKFKTLNIKLWLAFWSQIKVPPVTLACFSSSLVITVNGCFLLGMIALVIGGGGGDGGGDDNLIHTLSGPSKVDDFTDPPKRAGKVLSHNSWTFTKDINYFLNNISAMTLWKYLSKCETCARCGKSLGSVRTLPDLDIHNSKTHSGEKSNKCKCGKITGVSPHSAGPGF